MKIIIINTSIVQSPGISMRWCVLSTVIIRLFTCKMPKPVPVQAELGPIIDRTRNVVRIRSKDKMTFHAPIGTRDMSIEDLEENAKVAINRVSEKLDRGMMNMRSIYVTTSMGKSVKLL